MAAAYHVHFNYDIKSRARFERHKEKAVAVKGRPSAYSPGYWWARKWRLDEGCYRPLCPLGPDEDISKGVVLFYQRKAKVQTELHEM